MTNTTLSSVAVHVVGRYNEAGKTLVAAYRAGGHRVLGSTAARYAQAQKVTEFLATRLDADTGRVIDVLDRVAAVTTNGIESISALTVKIADQVADGAKKIEARVAAPASQEPVRIVKAKAKSANARKTARRSGAKSA